MTPEDWDAVYNIVEREGRPESIYKSIAEHFMRQGIELCAKECERQWKEGYRGDVNVGFSYTCRSLLRKI